MGEHIRRNGKWSNKDSIIISIITLKYLNKWYPEVYTGIKDFDIATQGRFYDDFLNLPNAETILGGLELDAELVNIWKISGKTIIADLTTLKIQLQQIGYVNFKTIDFLKNADGTYYGNKLIYADPSVTAQSITSGSNNPVPDAELKLFEEVCSKNGTIGYTPVSTNQVAVDGVLGSKNTFVQFKSNTFSNMTTRLNGAYTSAKGAGYKGVHVYMEITDASSNVNSVLNKWANTAPYSTNKVINDGTISAITVKTNTGWVDLDLTLIK